MTYENTFFSKLNENLQEKIYLKFMKMPIKDKFIIFTKLKYGDDITFKELSDKMHFSTIRSTYINYLEDIKSGIMEDNNGKNR
jgi:hypothetical protein